MCFLFDSFFFFFSFTVLTVKYLYNILLMCMSPSNTLCRTSELDVFYQSYRENFSYLFYILLKNLASSLAAAHCASSSWSTNGKFLSESEYLEDFYPSQSLVGTPCLQVLNFTLHLNETGCRYDADFSVKLSCLW